MPSLELRLYSAFAASPFGGNVAGVVYDSIGLSPGVMRQLAADLGAPTTGFVRELQTGGVGVRFFSPVAEMAMCGHVTIGVFAAMTDDGKVSEGTHRMATAAGEIPVSVSRLAGAPYVTMTQPAPRFDLLDVEVGRVAPLLGLHEPEIEGVGSAATGLRHLFVEVEGREPLAKIRANDEGLRVLCHELAIDTVGVFTLLDEAESGAFLRVRDLCHGVGYPEEAASGTTNGALASMLWRRGLLGRGGDRVLVRAEQGFEMGRPSLVSTELEISGGRIASVRVGGGAVRRIEGRLLF